MLKIHTAMQVLGLQLLPAKESWRVPATGASQFAGHRIIQVRRNVDGSYELKSTLKKIKSNKSQHCATCGGKVEKGYRDYRV
jgi:hypothetical protein